MILTALAAELLVSLQGYLKFGSFGPPKAEGEGGASEHSDVGSANLTSEQSDSPQVDLALHNGGTDHSAQPYLAPHPDLLI